MTSQAPANRRTPRWRGIDRHCLVIDTEAARWTYHRPLFARELRARGREGGMGWETACGLRMWAGHYGRDPGCMANRNVVELVAAPCRRCYPGVAPGGHVD